jgi:addiction module RelE/StbE family toxin
MVIWSTPAKDDLKNIFEYISQDSTYYAKRVIRNIIEKSTELEHFPERGRVIPEIKGSNIREVFIYSYRLMYEIDPENIYILGVIHGKRDFSPEDI